MALRKIASRRHEFYWHRSAAIVVPDRMVLGDYGCPYDSSPTLWNRPSVCTALSDPDVLRQNPPCCRGAAGHHGSSDCTSVHYRSRPGNYILFGISTLKSVVRPGTPPDKASRTKSDLSAKAHLLDVQALVAPIPPIYRYEIPLIMLTRFGEGGRGSARASDDVIGREIYLSAIGGQ